MPLLQQHVAHVMVERVDDKPLDSPDITVTVFRIVSALPLSVM
jgi:hypothetical protein